MLGSPELDRATVDRAAIDRGRRLHALLDRILEVDPADRRRALEAEPDQELVGEVVALLETEQEDFLAGSAVDRLNGRLVSDVSLPQLPGFTLRRQLGEGGMGRVFLAVEDASGREVALKMIRGFAPGVELRWRFEAERLALSRLNHPAIAQYYGMGSTPDGSPYVVMEYVDGIPITRYCDEHRLGVRARLELLISVCRGVEHAHRRQLLHRDLKPSNLLVTESDGQAAPKVIDFGIARALDGSLRDGTYRTGTALLGTPAYMGPEALDPADGSTMLDTRADVYSLGVVLYELLVGIRPHDDTSTGSLGLARRILEEEPPRPSTRWRTLDARTGDRRAERLGYSREELRRAITGDLDWIVMKAIAKERDRRYGSVSELAADLERHLRHEPVTARPPELPYLVRRFVRRHRVSVIAAVLIVLSLGAGFVARTVEANRAKRAQASAEASVDFLEDLIEQAKPYGKLDARSSIRDLVEVGVDFLEEGRLADPVARARAFSSFGRVYYDLGEFETAERLMQAALQLQREALPSDDPDLRQVLNRLGRVASELGRCNESERYFLEVLEMDRLSPPESRRLHGATLWALARNYVECGRFDEAEQMARGSLAAYDSLEPLAVRGRPLATLGRVAVARGDLAKAETLLRQALSNYPEEEHEKAALYEAMAELRGARQDWDGVAGDLRAALGIRLQTQDVNSGPALQTRIRLATALARAARIDEALEVLAPGGDSLDPQRYAHRLNREELDELVAALRDAAVPSAAGPQEADPVLRLVNEMRSAHASSSSGSKTQP